MSVREDEGLKRPNCPEGNYNGEVSARKNDAFAGALFKMKIVAEQTT